MPPAEAETGKEEDDRAQKRVGKRLQRIFRLGRRWRRNGHRGCRRNGTRWAGARRVGTRALRRCRRTVRRRARAIARTRWPMARRSVCGRREPVRRPRPGSTACPGDGAGGGKPPDVAAGALTSTTTFGTSGASAAVAAAASARAAAARAASAAAAASVSTDSARSWDSKRTSSATSGLTRRSSSRVTSYKSAKAIRFPISGADSARSHLETAWRDSPSCSASPSWENPRSRRNSARRWAISTFITVPFRVLFVTSRLSPYGFNPGCTSTLCGQFTRNE